MALEISLIAHEALCAAIFYSVFCRAVRSCEKVREDVRLAFFCLGLVSCAGMAAPLAWGLVPDGFALALLAAIVLVQLVTARHWAREVPERFLKSSFVPRARRSTDKELRT